MKNAHATYRNDSGRQGTGDERGYGALAPLTRLLEHGSVGELDAGSPVRQKGRAPFVFVYCVSEVVVAVDRRVVSLWYMQYERAEEKRHLGVTSPDVRF